MGYGFSIKKKKYSRLFIVCYCVAASQPISADNSGNIIQSHETTLHNDSQLISQILYETSHSRYECLEAPAELRGDVRWFTPYDTRKFLSESNFRVTNLNVAWLDQIRYRNPLRGLRECRPWLAIFCSELWNRNNPPHNIHKI